MRAEAEDLGLTAALRSLVAPPKGGPADIQNHTNAARPVETSPKPDRTKQTHRDLPRPAQNPAEHTNAACQLKLTQKHTEQHYHSEASTDQQKSTQNRTSTARPAETNQKQHRNTQTQQNQQRPAETSRDQHKTTKPAETSTKPDGNHKSSLVMLTAKMVAILQLVKYIVS